MPQYDTYFLLKDAYGEETSVENFDPNATARSMKFNSTWSGKGGESTIPHSRLPPPPPGENRPPREHRPPHHYDHNYDYERRRIYNKPYYYYDYDNIYFPHYPNNQYPYLPYFYNIYTSYSPYNLNYSQYIPKMNMFWDSINKSILNYPEYPSLSDIDMMKRFIVDLPIFIPCNDSCKSFMKIYIQEQISNLDSICQNKKTLVDFFQNLRHQFYIKFDNYNVI